ncbi:hypothetical protein PCCS19_02760 [Paenibacillus sp. CCS19]|uniref:cysteine-rich CWC family protein n=1 Tax=Paenibacillus sp. CCS19 TaxID=3158387 RepID=UPI00256CFDA7|nr:cysteine-rich CWC family protein [Paenibacillus cellulosilyticus]GMK37223.1 hypothetical protein PCCS19_02760 [Paenibacillus cellulosilyticus]
MTEQSAAQCPICGGNNQCGSVSGNETCWCMKEKFPQEIFRLVPEDQIDKACICEACLAKFKESNSNQS